MRAFVRTPLCDFTSDIITYGMRILIFKTGMGIDCEVQILINGSNADCAIILPGAPIRERFPPIAAANTNGIRKQNLS